MKISAVIITYNEERNIERCLASVVPVVDEIVVVDSCSTDRTQILCERFGAKFITESFRGYRDQKNFAVENASFDMILSLDADEALTDVLASEILAIKASGPEADAYAVNRLNNYCGTFVRHGQWVPDRKIRLWDRRKGKWEGGSLHELVVMKKGAKVHRLSGELLHYTYSSLSEQLSQYNNFSSIAALELFEQGKRSYFMIDLVIYPFFVFLKSYFIKLGFLDGYTGLLVAITISYYRFLKYAKLRMLWKAQAR